VEVRPEELDRFAQLSGDISAIHISREAAQTSGFPDRVVHGLLAGAYVSRMVGMELPGEHWLLQHGALRRGCLRSIYEVYIWSR